MNGLMKNSFGKYPWSYLVDGDESSYWDYFSWEVVLLLFYHLINPTTYLLGWIEASYPTIKELHEVHYQFIQCHTLKQAKK